jgi:hypothetical protein
MSYALPFLLLPLSVNYLSTQKLYLFFFAFFLRVEWITSLYLLVNPSSRRCIETLNVLLLGVLRLYLLVLYCEVSCHVLRGKEIDVRYMNRLLCGY